MIEPQYRKVYKGESQFEDGAKGRWTAGNVGRGRMHGKYVMWVQFNPGPGLAIKQWVGKDLELDVDAEPEAVKRSAKFALGYTPGATALAGMFDHFAHLRDAYLEEDRLYAAADREAARRVQAELCDLALGRFDRGEEAGKGHWGKWYETYLTNEETRQAVEAQKVLNGHGFESNDHLKDFDRLLGDRIGERRRRKEAEELRRKEEHLDRLMEVDPNFRRMVGHLRDAMAETLTADPYDELVYRMCGYPRNEDEWRKVKAEFRGIMESFQLTDFDTSKLLRLVRLHGRELRHELPPFERKAGEFYYGDQVRIVGSTDVKKVSRVGRRMIEVHYIGIRPGTVEKDRLEHARRLPWQMTLQEFSKGEQRRLDFRLRDSLLGCLAAQLEDLLSHRRGDGDGRSLAITDGGPRPVRELLDGIESDLADVDGIVARAHKQVVQRALHEGRPVPDAVRREYQDESVEVSPTAPMEAWKLTTEELLAAGYAAARSGREWWVFDPSGRRLGFVGTPPGRSVVVGSERAAILAWHRYAVEAAVARGEGVPSGVLQEYPALASLLGAPQAAEQAFWQVPLESYVQAKLECHQGYRNTLASGDATNISIVRDQVITQARRAHEAAVTIAVAEGRPVPPMVLVDYPGLVEVAEHTVRWDVVPVGGGAATGTVEENQHVSTSAAPLRKDPDVAAGPGVGKSYEAPVLEDILKAAIRQFNPRDGSGTSIVLLPERNARGQVLVEVDEQARGRRVYAVRDIPTRQAGRWLFTSDAAPSGPAQVEGVA